MPSESPRWSFIEPSAEEVRTFLADEVGANFSYPQVGESKGGTPAGYALDHNRVVIGNGEKVFAAACEALRAWKMFPAPWTRITPQESEIRAGAVVAMQANALGLWWLNACKIVYVVDEVTPVRRWGFAYGTLPAHVEQGEERFSVELQPDGSVWYDLRAFSRPRYWPVRLGRPIARALQRRFVRESQAAVAREVVLRCGSRESAPYA